MPRWSPDAALRLEAAATLLFERQGYAGTTVPQIAAEAGLTTRTFFRHFSDKRDVLFLRDREFPQAVREFVESVPPESDGAATVRAGLSAACRELQGWRRVIARRRAIIRSEPALHERDLLQSHHLGRAIEESLHRRGIDPRQSHTLAALAVTCFDLAMVRWLEGPAELLLDDALTAVWNDMRDCLRS
ncbi:TetR/AcrR family transcriptional regulator [Microbacterium sp. C5A9]|uniref:TetR/AcrR family transcriptional regulator n=1 Tax=Microbacterium sp. C5A9 TaxID=2736663 RepID=UPI001F522A37|nr:TetR/AcrR family transcriptional regulator [Microbacterium sp. C5A9]MCI1018327.1 TetR/AcrR family transcriptional regulator [Microbacterium sp. C5A9]